jgi:WD40 repeat protein
VFPRVAPEVPDCTLPPEPGPETALGQSSHGGRGADEEAAADLAGHARYRITRLLGQGGMGAVYEAEHRLMERTVALKVIRPALMADEGAVERFRREVKAAARLHHPNIVTAYDADQAGNTHFLVMEFVPGRSLAAHLRENGPLPVRQACDYARQAALGLQHAHEQGMVHRDIKPDNLMLTGDGQVKILDFGLARFAQAQAADIALQVPAALGSPPGQLTAVGSIMGTPDYMAPEQAQDSRAADSRADIYALGCSLYQLLTGRVPFPKGDAVDKIRQHVKEEPEPLARQRPDVPRGLAAVVAKMMAKDPAQRYQTPAEVAEALRPFARPEEVRPRRRSRLPAVALALIVVGALAAGLVTYRIQTTNGEVVIHTDDPEIEVVTRQGGRIVRIVNPRSKQTWELDTDRYELSMADRPDGLTIPLPDKEPFTLKRDGKGVLTVTRQPAAAAKGSGAKDLASRASPSDALKRADVPADYLAFAARVAGHDPPAELVGVLGDTRFLTQGGYYFPAFSHDGKLLAAADAADVVLFDAAAGRPVRRLMGHGGEPRCLAFSPDDHVLASCGADGTVRLWDVESGKVRRRWDTGAEGSAVAFSPDGSTLAAYASGGKQPVLWDVRTGDERAVLRGHEDVVCGLAFHPDGTLIATGCADGKVRLFEARSGDLKQTLEHPTLDPRGPVDRHRLVVAFSGDGKRLATGSDAEVRGWDCDGAAVAAQPLWTAKTAAAGLLAFTADGTTLLTAPSWQRTQAYSSVVRWDARTGGEVGRFAFPIWGTAIVWRLSPDGRWIAVPARFRVHVLDAATGQPRLTPAGHTWGLLTVAYSPDGRILVSGDVNGEVRLWDAVTGRQLGVLTDNSSHVRAVAFSPNGRLLASAGWDGAARLWEVPPTGPVRPLHTLTGVGPAEAVAFSPDGGLLAIGGDCVTLRDPVTGDVQGQFTGHRRRVQLAFAPDGGRIASGADGDPTVKIWDVAGRKLERDLPNGEPAFRLAFSPDGRTLAAAGSVVRLWDTTTGKHLEDLTGPKGVIAGLAFHPGGQMVAAGSADGTARLYDLGKTPVHQKVWQLFPTEAWVHGVAFSPEGRHLATANPDGTIYILRLANKGEVPRVPE